MSSTTSHTASSSTPPAIAGGGAARLRIHVPDASPAPPPRPMRLAIVRQQYRADGGAERFTSSLVAALGQRRYDVTVLTRNWEQTDGVSAVRCNPPRLGRLSRDWGFAWAVARHLKSHPFDLVQSNERVAGCDVYRAGDGVHRQWLAQRRRVQSWPARLAAALSPYHAYLKRVERRVFEHPRLRAVICNSQMVRTEILQYFHIDPARLHVIYNAVDTRRFSPQLRQHRLALRSQFGIPQDVPLFVFVGSGFERKGLRFAIEALIGVPRAYLLVVGGDKQAPHYVRLTQQFGVAGRVRFTGVLRDVGPCYGAADALLLPTLYDPMPNVALEAMASGLPALVSTGCGAAELLAKNAGDDGPCGLVCDALDHSGLIAAMQKLADPQVALAMGRAARKRVEPFTADAMAAQLTALYRSLLT